jgi:hypothetical protein
MSVIWKIIRERRQGTPSSTDILKESRHPLRIAGLDPAALVSHFKSGIRGSFTPVTTVQRICKARPLTPKLRQRRDQQRQRTRR